MYIFDRLFDRPSVSRQEQEVSGPQEWLDLDRERSYDYIQSFFDGIIAREGMEGFRRWFVNYSNDIIEAGGSPSELTIEDFADVECVNHVSDSASRIAGKPVSRTIFMFKDSNRVAWFYKTVLNRTDTKVCDALGITIPAGGIIPGDELNSGVSFIICIANYFVTAGHEVSHTIDPHLQERKGYDQVIGELLAFYHQKIVDPQDGIVKDSDEAWEDLLTSIWGGGYYDRFSLGMLQPLSNKEYGDLVQRSVEKLRHLRKVHGHLKAQRMIIQMRSLEELFAVV
jgi:hypothetical protein